MKTLLLTIATLSLPFGLCGCPAYADFAAHNQRAYAVSYDADQKSGSLSMTFTPYVPPSTVPDPKLNPVYAMDDATIDRITRIIEDRAKKNAPNLSYIPAEMPK